MQPHDERTGGPEAAEETDSRFLSGPWAGYFVQWGRRGRQKLHLRFAGGRVSGIGFDAGGDFFVRGTYDVATGVCALSKSYDAHSVEYDGSAGADGITGRWTINYLYGLTDRGEFHIWPDGSEDGAHAHAEASVPAARRRDE